MTREQLEERCGTWLDGNGLSRQRYGRYLANFVERMLWDDFQLDLERPAKTAKPGGGT